MIEQVKKEESYTIDSIGYVSINVKVGDVKCDECRNLLANMGDGVFLVRTSITIVDTRNKEIKMKCGKCAKFTAVKLESA